MYRQYALPYLVEDFEHRCAYSLVHISDMTKMEMEVDHVNPATKQRSKVAYTDLVIAYRPCNNSKRAHWPTKAQQRDGVRYLLPRTDVDYGTHIFEDPVTHKVWGATPAGIWHIEKLNLNDEFLVKRRAKRARWNAILAGDNTILTFPPGVEDKASASIAEIKELSITAIPPLPLKPQPVPDLDDLEKQITGS